VTIRGIAFPFNKGTTSFPAKSEDDDTIEDNIRRILQTKRGDRVMRPNTGSDTMGFVFENIGPMLRASINHEVRRALSAGEPRAQVLRVLALQRENKPVKGHTVVVVVVYRVHGEIRQLVVPMSNRSAA
jgi:phage baseplate assembly protein W